MNILVINAGSSSLKYQLFDTATGTVLQKGLCERIGLDPALPDHAAAIRQVVDGIQEKIDAVGHRVVHGGEFFNESVVITDEVLKAIEDCVPLAPLHNPPNLTGITACRKVMGDIPQVAVFDTAFHQTMPPEAYLYALPYEFYEKYKVRRYGFHGTSHRYVAERAAKLLDKPLDELKIITCHLGNGSSVTAIDRGRSIDTSMGFTPLEGVPMGTRSGSIDPAITSFLAEKENLSSAEITNILNKKSGVLGISGVSSDFRDLLAAAEQGNERAKLAVDHFVYKVKCTVGAYAAALGGVDALVFTAGVGENNTQMREWITEGLGFMGLTIDPAKNNVRGAETVVSADGSPGKILVIPTNEELVIALDTEALVAPAGANFEF